MCFHKGHENHLHPSRRKIFMHNFDINRTVKYITEYQQLFPTCVHESRDILAEHFYTILRDGSRKAILWSHEKKMG